MTQIIVGNPSTTARLDQTGADADNRRFWAAPGAEADSDPSSSATLAHAIVAFEADVTGQEPDSVLLADDSDSALAAVLVATKLLIPVAAMPAATRPSSANARLIAQLAGAYTRSA